MTPQPSEQPRLPMDERGQYLNIGDSLRGHGMVTSVTWPIGICQPCGRIVQVETGEGHMEHRGAAPDPVASPLDVERLHRIIGYAGEGIPAWTHKPPPESRVPTFLAFNVRDVHAAINRWARLEGQPVAEEPRPDQEETP